MTVYRANPATSARNVIQVPPVRGTLPRNIALSPDGVWLLAAGADSNPVTMNKNNPATGELTDQTKGVINAPAPFCIFLVTQ